jgi:anti-sigma factor RsiW
VICAEIKRLVDAYVDNELDVRGSVDFEAHLEGCASCSADVLSLRALRSAVRADLTRHPLPPALEKGLRAALRREALGPDAPQPDAPQPIGEKSAPAPQPRRRRLALWSAVAPAAAAGALLVVVASRLWPPPPGPSVEDAVIAAHVRSLLANHLTDVASSDQHTVKPWFQGKLDYSVEVTDFAAEGFPLAGGRLDYVEDAPAAALVYRRAQHVVNLFVWPSKLGGDSALSHLSRRGYGAFRWAKDGMNYRAVSDLNEVDLKKFVDLVQRR